MTKTNVTEFLNNNKDELIKLRNDGLMVKDISKIYGINVSTLSGFFTRNNVKKRRPLTQEDKLEIVRRYLNGESPRLICNDYHITKSRVPEIVEELGFKRRRPSEARRKHSLDDSYFDVIDTQNKAYILGLLLADGSRSSRGHSICLGLQATDVDILNRINQELNSNRPLSFVELSKKNKKYSDQYCLHFNGEHICSELSKYGITPKKDFTVTFPSQISRDLYRHVIRGLLDGDGFICKIEKRCGITGNKPLIEFVASFVQEELGVHCSITSPHNSKNTRDLRISGGRQVKRFLDYIYTDADMYIKRKHDTYNHFYCNDTILSSAA